MILKSLNDSSHPEQVILGLPNYAADKVWVETNPFGFKSRLHRLFLTKPRILASH